MKFVSLSRGERDRMLAELRSMPDFLAQRFGELSSEEAARKDPRGGFGPVEHCWHLADLEVEGFALRIARLVSEAEPALPDFDGGRIAEERSQALHITKDN